ncbi:WapI family immunity protein [Alkalicoccobacillus murimartini]|uniref:Uncharacterized protein n=1 Tax=Alkalicoccobacillus murimartini TaxID=171685 RepID=A0ABT9YMJ8_9BACI|nr:hypothetical protein [Alkalicoccobacillus murimartini]MDQ0209078.1 hypothetical protein [Alkalicoccobacillus murimartini]
MHTFKIGDSPYFIEMRFAPHERDIGDDFDEIESEITIQSGKYSVRDAEVWISTNQLYQLFQGLTEGYQKLKGKVIFSNREDSIYIEMTLHSLGQLDVKGHIQDIPSETNTLDFEFQLDQSYLPKTIDQLKEIMQQLGKLK